MESPGTLPVDPSRLWRLNVSTYHRMIDAGVLDEDDHVELVEGVLVIMTPQSAPHARVIQRLDRWLHRAIPGDSLTIRPQLPLTLADDSEPEPDFAVVETVLAEAPDHPSQALLVIEVSRSSIAYDLGPKAVLYARAAIPEYWVIDVEHQAITVHTLPDRDLGQYQKVERCGGESIASATGVFKGSLSLRELFANATS